MTAKGLQGGTEATRCVCMKTNYDGRARQCQRATLEVRSRVRLAEDSEPYLPAGGARCPYRAAQRVRSPRQPRFFWMHAICTAALLFAGSLSAQGQADPVYTWATLAGPLGGAGQTDGTGPAARFNHPSGVAVDSAGNVYVADRDNHTIRKVTAEGVVTTLAGSPGLAGSTDGTGAAARLKQPCGVAVDTAGNLFVADTGNHTIRKVTAEGVVATLAGSAGMEGAEDGTGSAARFYGPAGVGVDTAGNVYVADRDNHTIRKVTAEGVVTTLAGSPGYASMADGTGDSAYFHSPSGVAVDSAGDLVVADTENNMIRKVTAEGVVTTLAGNTGGCGREDGTGSAAWFCSPTGVTVDSAGNVFVADRDNHTIRKVTAAGVVTTLAGLPGASGSGDGTGQLGDFYSPSGVAVDTAGNVFVADRDNHLVRKMTSEALVTTLAGLPEHAPGTADGSANEARFHWPHGVAVDSTGNVFVADEYNHTIRKVTAEGRVTTFAGRAGSEGHTDGEGAAARFISPYGLAVDSVGNVYVADRFDLTIRKITPTGLVTTLAGRAGDIGWDDGVGTRARFYLPTGVAVDSAGNVYVADSWNQTIRKVTAARVVTTLAGVAGSRGSADGTGNEAQFLFPSGVAVDSVGNLYVADMGNSTIRKVTAEGVVTTLAGLAQTDGFLDGTGADARFRRPYGVAVDNAGNVFVADTLNSAIRKVTPAGVVTTVGGDPNASPGGNEALFGSPYGVAVDSAGNLYVADTSNNRIAKGTFPNPRPSIAWVLDGARLRLAWPERFLGWELQAQTNTLSVGLGTNWFPVPDSKLATQLTIPIDPAAPAVAYRLRSP